MDDKTLMKLLDITPERLKEIDRKRKKSSDLSAALTGLSGAAIMGGMTYAAKKGSKKKDSKEKRKEKKTGGLIRQGKPKLAKKGYR